MTAPHTLESRDDGRLLSGERHVLELIGTGANLDVVLDALCRVIDEESGLMSSIFLLDREGEYLSLAAGPHLPEDWSHLVRSLQSTPTNTSCGAAVNTREQVIVSDVLASPLFAQWHDDARRSRIRAVWSTPFFSKDGRVLGTFAVMSHEMGTPSDAHLSLVARATYLAGIAVERHQTDESLRESERRFSRAFYANPACVTITRFSDGRFLYVNDAFVRLFGYSRAEAIGQTALGLGLYADPAQRPSLMQRLASRQLHDAELTARTKSGAIIDVVVSMERIEMLGEESVLAIATDVTNRKQSEEALRESEARFRQIAENIREVFWMRTADLTQLLYVSPGYESIWGRTCASLYQDPLSWIAAIHPDDRVRVTSIIETERNLGFEVEYRLVRPDGSIRWIRDRGFPVTDESGRLYRVAGVAEDITERRRVDEQLRTSEHLLAEAQRLAHIGSWNWDLVSSTVTWSDELYRIFGFQPLEIDPAREAMAFVHDDDRDAVRRTIDTTFKTKEPYSFFYRIRRRDGHERILHSNGYLVCNQHGEPTSVFGTTQDVTERKRSEDALQRSEQLLRLVLEAIPVGVVVIDPAGDIILGNQASSRIWAGMIQSGRERYAKSKAWWHDTGKRVEPDEWASQRALTKGETAINEVVDIETFDGVRKIINTSAIPIRDEHRAIVGAVVVNEDISARKTAELGLEASVSQMQTLATRLMHAQDDERRRIAQMLHETTAQDLAGLKMLLARLHRTISSVSPSDRAVLEESIDVAERSMAGIRTLSYLLYPPFLDENGLLSALRWYAAGFSERSGIRIELELPQTFARLPRDVETTLFRVVQEALINIHRHADSPTARMHLRVDGGELVLEIEDHGRGMPAALVTPHAPDAGPVGVGIAGMRERLKQLGGTLEIESSDRGAVVRARFPIPSGAS